MSVLADDDVIMHGDAERSSDVDDRARHLDIRLRGRRIAGRVVVHQTDTLLNIRIVLKKSFSGEERKFPGPLMLFVRRDVRDHIVSYKNDHGPSYRRYRAVQR